MPVPLAAAAPWVIAGVMRFGPKFAQMAEQYGPRLAAMAERAPQVVMNYIKALAVQEAITGGIVGARSIPKGPVEALKDVVENEKARFQTTPATVLAGPMVSVGKIIGKGGPVVNAVGDYLDPRMIMLDATETKMNTPPPEYGPSEDWENTTFPEGTKFNKWGDPVSDEEYETRRITDRAIPYGQMYNYYKYGDW